MKSHPALKTSVVLDGNSRELPKEVRREISDEMWPAFEMDNDSTLSYTTGEGGWNDEEFPAVDAFLKEHEIAEVVISYGW